MEISIPFPLGNAIGNFRPVRPAVRKQAGPSGCAPTGKRRLKIPPELSNHTETRYNARFHTTLFLRFQMFHTVEKFRLPAQILLGLIAVSFVGFGAVQLSAPGSDYIVKIGGQKISQHDLSNALQNVQASGGKAERGAVLQSLVQNAYLTEGAQLMGIAVSDQQIKQLIVDNPDFHDANGKFSQALLSEYLSQRHMTEDQFVADIRRQFQVLNLMNVMQNGALVSDAQAEWYVKLFLADRTVRTATFPPEPYASQVKQDDATLKRYYDANKKNYIIPQGAKIEYVELNLKNLADKQTVGEAELKKAFDEQSTSAPPKRDIAHIFFRAAKDAPAAEHNAVKARAEKVLAEVKANPASFGALAKKHSQYEQSAPAGGKLGWQAKDGGLPKEFEDAAFNLEKGSISGLVQTPEGYHIITVLGIQDKPVFDDAEKARLTAELKAKKAAAEFNKAKEKLAEASFAHPNSLTEVAKATGLQVVAPDEWLTRANGEAAQLPKELLDAVFSDEVMKKKHNSEPVTVAQDTVRVVRVKEERPERTLPFEEVKDEVKAAYLREEAGKTAAKKAQEALAELKAGRQPAGIKWSPVEKMTAQQAQQAMPPEAYNALVLARPQNGKPAYVQLEGLPAPVIVEVQSLAAPADLKTQLPQFKQMMAQRQVDVSFDALFKYLEKTVKREQGAQKADTAE